MLTFSIFGDQKKWVITAGKGTYRYDNYWHFKHSAFIPYVKQANDLPAVPETAKDKSLCSIKMPVTIYHSTWHNIPETLNQFIDLMESFMKSLCDLI